MAEPDDAQPDPAEGEGTGAGPDAATGSEDQSSGSAPQGQEPQGQEPLGQEPHELTVDDILAAAQTAEAEDSAESVAEPADVTGSQLLNDLKRLQAEYANYRRRTEDQREREIERAKGEAVKGILPVLDDLDRAVKHGDLEAGTPFSAIADKVRAVAERLGVVSYGVAGEAFDPQQHEAIFQAPTPGVTTPTVLEVVEVGYRLGAVELRPAKVVVAVPAE